MTTPDCCERDPEQREHKHPYSVFGDWRAAVQFMRANGVRRLKTAVFEMELDGPVASLTIDPALLGSTETPPPPPPAPVGVENGGEPTEEQLLMWSTGQPLPPAQKPEVQ